MNTITVKDGTQIYTKIGDTGQAVVFHGWPLLADNWDTRHREDNQRNIGSGGLMGRLNAAKGFCVTRYESTTTVRQVVMSLRVAPRSQLRLKPSPHTTSPCPPVDL
jgi:hypothetical protein